ncbi:hypothetical protein PHLGIDRAFT_424549 [Phlebiopsis gigantea 11061_1 CR5-6]|uniref:Uncharacterized protein n=1 Tax=Phlebiopsis gigantea (strain 11061_1 CR5-6) TaxID=745531 RepID=A0A0C3SAV1_PHLG1|nr:hypothetical protein PHLGIDRAFT_424549 [Phlebiopsis gigantea 11061_1 CR5-6]
MGLCCYMQAAILGTNIVQLPKCPVRPRTSAHRGGGTIPTAAVATLFYSSTAALAMPVLRRADNARVLNCRLPYRGKRPCEFAGRASTSAPPIQRSTAEEVGHHGILSAMRSGTCPARQTQSTVSHAGSMMDVSKHNSAEIHADETWNIAEMNDFSPGSTEARGHTCSSR